jgi:ABC-2 type transport system permease protein
MSGLMAVFRKELADNFNSLRFFILAVLMYGAAILLTTFVAAQNIRSGITETTQFIFLRLFTVTGDVQLFSFPVFMAFFIPILGIMLGFDAINGERASGNLSRVSSQPIYRDSIINGKFLAGLVTIAVLVFGIMFLVGGIGLRMIGVPPSPDEILRLFAFIFVTIIYGAFWLALAILCSVFFNRIATSALASLAIWVFVFFFVSVIASLIAGVMVPIDQSSSQALQVHHNEVAAMINLISPAVLYSQSIQVLLIPSHPVMFVLSMYYTGLEPNPLPLGQSLLIAWPQMISLIALTALCFAGSYIRFMREEIRAT